MATPGLVLPPPQTPRLRSQHWDWPDAAPIVLATESNVAVPPADDPSPPLPTAPSLCPGGTPGVNEHPSSTTKSADRCMTHSIDSCSRFLFRSCAAIELLRGELANRGDLA